MSAHSRELNKNKEHFVHNPTDKNYLDRVIRHDSARKGVAAAAAGVLIAIVSEALWPTAS